MIYRFVLQSISRDHKDSSKRVFKTVLSYCKVCYLGQKYYWVLWLFFHYLLFLLILLLSYCNNYISPL